MDDDVPDEGLRLRLLQLATFISNADRSSIPPLLVLIGADLHEPLTAVAAIASGYFLAYGLLQAVWGVASDRIGRVRVMRIALCGAAVSGLCSALAPNLLVLGLTRVVAGACFAAVIPTTLVYVGDVWPLAVRQATIAKVLTASALGIALATVGSGVLADAVGWRAVFAVPAFVAAALAFALARLPEPVREPGVGAPLRSVGRVLRSRWGELVLLVVLAEGVVVLGTLTYLAPAVQSLGLSAGVAGVVAAAFGVGALCCSPLVRALVGRASPPVLAAIGGACLVVAWLVPAIAVTVPTVTVAGLLVGAAWAFLHTTLQTWATEMVPGERATSVALFATALFLGSAVGAALAAPLAEAGAFEQLFALSALGSVPMVVVAVLGRWRYARSR